MPPNYLVSAQDGIGPLDSFKIDHLTLIYEDNQPTVEMSTCLPPAVVPVTCCYCCFPHSDSQFLSRSPLSFNHTPSLKSQSNSALHWAFSVHRPGQADKKYLQNSLNFVVSSFHVSVALLPLLVSQYFTTPAIGLKSAPIAKNRISKSDLDRVSAAPDQGTRWQGNGS